MIIRHIKQAYQKRLLLPVIALILLFLITGKLSLNGYLHPNNANTVQLENITENKEQTFLHIDNLNLNYTGYDYLKNGNTIGYIYYSLENGQCRFYILPKDENTSFQTSYQNLSLTGKLILEEPLYERLTEALAADLDWTTEGLRQITSPYILSSIDLFPWNLALHILIVGFIAIVIFFDLFRSVYYYFFPERVAGLRSLRKTNQLKELLPLVELEMETADSENGLYLTEHYLVFLSQKSTAVIPIEDISWIYLQNRLTRFLILNLSMSSIIHIVTKDKLSTQCPLSESTDYGMIKAHLKNRNPDIISGYSRINKLLFQKLIKNQASKI